MWIPDPDPRVLSKEAQATDEEKLQAYASFVANAGTYAVSGSTIMIHPFVAQVPNSMSGGFSKYECRVEEDTSFMAHGEIHRSAHSGSK